LDDGVERKFPFYPEPAEQVIAVAEIRVSQFPPCGRDNDGKYLQENRIKVLDAKQQNDFYLQGEATGLKLKEELAKIMKQ
jgi:hypothetical protein